MIRKLQESPQLLSAAMLLKLFSNVEAQYFNLQGIFIQLHDAGQLTATTTLRYYEDGYCIDLITDYDHAEAAMRPMLLPVELYVV
ncbi:MAG: hypothetical protein EOO88_38915 [Pedobacter sp.]|nr:MAG: hypothetical protein EOO88_38915 [Pedobacter sp.]